MTDSQQIIGDLKKKQKVLKSALLQQRSTRQKLESEIQTITAKSKTFEESLNDAESHNSTLTKENQKLREELNDVSYKFEMLNQAQNKLKEANHNKKKGAAENKYLVESQNFLQMENQKLETNYNCLKDQKEEVERALKLAEETLISKQSEFQTFQDNTNSKIILMNSQVHQLQQLLQKEKDENFKRSQEMSKVEEKIQADYKEARQEKDKAIGQLNGIQQEKQKVMAINVKLRDQNEAQKEAISQLTQNLHRHQKQTAQLAEKLLILKNQLLQNHAPFKTFKVLKMGALRPIETSINFRKNEDSDYVVETLINGKIQSINVFDIDSIKQVEGCQNESVKIDLIIAGGNKISYTFETKEVKEIIKTFKQFQMKAAKNQELE